MTNVDDTISIEIIAQIISTKVLHEHEEVGDVDKPVPINIGDPAAKFQTQRCQRRRRQVLVIQARCSQ
jgi:hypothetical protein